MVAVVSGNGLGLFNTSLTQLGSALGGSSGIGQSRDNQYVNIATGNLLLTGWDESLFGHGFNTGQARTYNSLGSFGQAGADGWQTGYERTVKLLSGTLNTAGSIVQRATADGSTINFNWDATRSAYVAMAGEGAHDTIVYSGSGSTAKWLWTEGSSQVQETYNAGTPGTAGRLEQIVDLASTASYVLTYNGSNQLTVITGANGETEEFGYDGSGRLTSVSTRERNLSTGVLELKGQVTYGYDAAGRLSYVQTDLTPTDATDNTWDATTLANNDGKRYRVTYTYADSSSLLITGVATSDGVTMAYTYSSGKIATVTQGNASDGSSITLTYTYAAGSTTVTDSAGRAWTYSYDGSGQLTSVQEPIVNTQRPVTNYIYDTSGNITRISQSIVGAGTNTLDTVFKYDTNGNVILQRDRLGNTIERTFSAQNKVLTEIAYTTPDADGLDPTFVGNTNLPSGALVTRYVYDTTNPNLLRFVINGNGEVSENQYNASGVAMGLVSMSRHFIGAAYDTSGLANNATPTLAQMTTWVTGKESASARTDVNYDAQGRIKQTVAYATVDSSGVGVLDIGTAISNFTYDAQGLLRQKIVVHGASRTVAGVPPTGSEVTDYAYDGLGRLLSVIQRDYGTASNDDTNSVATVYAYTDSGNKLQVTFDTGMVRTETRNKAGLLTSISEVGTVNGSQVTRTTQNYYDATGRLRAVQDPTTLGISYLFYDSAGRLSATVDATGDVTQTVYDEIGRAVQSVRYAALVNTSGWISAGAVVKDTLVYAATQPGSMTGNQAWVQTSASADRNAFCTYDSAGRKSTETDAAGLVTTYAYDGASRLLSTTIAKPSDGTVIPRVTRYFYDAVNRQVATLDAEGYLTEAVFDAGGRLVTTIRYATLTNSTFWTSGTLAQLRPSTVAGDQTTRYFYDGRGNQTGVLNAEGYLTEFVYDEAANQRAVKAYAKQLTGLTGTETLATLRTSALTSPPTESIRLTQRSFNGLGQVTTDLNAEGTVTRYSYDEAGRLVRTEIAQGQTEVRENYNRYDVFGNLIGQISGEQAVAAETSLGGKLLTDSTLTENQLNTAYAAYGLTHSYDLVGRRTESVDALGNKTWYFYDYAGRQTFVVRGVKDSNGVLNAQGEVTETRYTAFGQISDALVYTGRITITTPGSRASVQTAIGALTVGGTDTRRQYIYDQRGLLTQATDAESIVSNYSYTAFGQLYQELRAVGTGAAVTIQHAYDKRGLETSRTDALGTAIARNTSQTYDAFGRVVTSTDGSGTVTSFSYDRLGRQLTTSRTVSGAVETSSLTYDAFDRTVSQTDTLGNVTTYAYSDTNRSLVVTTPEGVAIATVHNRFGQTVTVSQLLPNGSTATTTTVYDRNGAVSSITDAMGQVTTYVSDVRGQLLTTTDASGRKIDYTYDAIGRVLTRTQDKGTGTLNLTTSYAYDGQGRQVTVTDASGRVTALSYDREGRVTQIAKDPAGLNLRTTYTYDGLGRQLTVTEGFGSALPFTTQVIYDALGRRTSEIVAPGSLNLTTAYAYDADDNLVTRTDATGQLTRYSYDEDNQLRFVVDATGAITEMVYDKTGNVVLSRTYAKALTAASLASLATAPSVATIQGLITAQSIKNDTLDAQSFRVFDRDGRVRFVVDGGGDLSETRYDSAGRVARTLVYTAAIDSTLMASVRANTATVTSFAGFVSSNQASANSLRRIYNNDGQVTYLVDTLGNATHFWFDAAGRTVATRSFAQAINTSTITDATTGAQVDALVTWSGSDQGAYTVYDGAGRAVFSLDVVGGVVQTVYDGAGRVLRTIAFATGFDSGPLLGALFAGTAQTSQITPTANAALDAVTYNVFDAAGRARFSMDASNAITELRYDDAGHVTQALAYSTALADSNVINKVKTSGATMATSATVADLAAFVTANEANAHSTASVYDAAGRRVYQLSRNTGNVAEVSQWRYDAAGRVIADVDYGVTVAYAQNQTAAQVATAITNAGGDLASAQHLTQYAYDAAGRQRFTLDDSGAVSEQRYDGAGRVIETRQYGTRVSVGTVNEANVAAAVAGQTGVRSTVYAYNAAGRLASMTDALSQTESYAYDGVGHRTSRTDKLGSVWTYAYDAAGRLTTETSPAVYVYSYDGSGNLSVPVSMTQIVTTTSYDALGNVVSRTENAGTADARTTQYVYDALGRQIKTIFPDAWMVNANGTLVAQNVTTDIQITYDLLGRAVVQKDVRGNYSYKVYDQLGRLAYDIDAEGNVSKFGYDIYGEQTTLTRYANKLVTTGGVFTGWSAGQAISLAQMQSAMTANGSDRTLTTTYDSVGNKLSVTQSAISFYKNDGTAGSGSLSPTTLFTYDAYNQCVKDSVLLDGTLYADTYHYYDDLGHETLTVDAEGYATSRQYDALGQLTRLVEYARALDTSSLVIGTPPAQPAAGDATSGFDRVSTFSFDVLGRKIGQTVLRAYVQTDGTTGVRNVLTTIGYDAGDRVTSSTVDGATTTMAYDALGRTTSVKEAERDVLVAGADASLIGSTGNDLSTAALYERSSPYTTLDYDAFGNVIRQTRYANGWRAIGGLTADPSRDQVSTIRYDKLGRAVINTDAVGNKTCSGLDNAGNLVHSWYTLSGSASSRDAKIDASYTYDKVGRQLTNTVTRQLVSGGTIYTERGDTVVYNAFGEIVQKTAAGFTDILTNVYNNAGQLITSNQNGASRSFGYNLAGAQTFEQHTVSEFNGTTLVDTPEATRQVVDRLGRVTQIVLPSYTSSPVTTYVNRTLDRWGNVIAQIDPRGFRTTFEYNDQNQMTRQVAPQVEVVGVDGNVTWQSPETRWSYDSFGRLLSVKDANGNVEQTVYNIGGQAVKIIDGTGAVTLVGFDALGNAHLTQDAVGHITWQTFDKNGRVVAMGDDLPNGAGTARVSEALQQFVLNQNGQRISVNTRIDDATNAFSYYDFDGQNHLIRSQTATGVVVTDTYDALGNKNYEYDGVHDQLWTYDIYGRLATHRDLGGYTVTNGYDAASGQQISQTTTRGTSGNVTLYYYPNGLVRRRIEDVSPNQKIYDYKYDANGNCISEDTTTKDGSGLAVHQLTTSTYDSNNRLSRVTSQDVLTGTIIMDVRYGYDAVGNRRVAVAASAYGAGVTPPSTANKAPVVIGQPQNYSAKVGATTTVRLRASDVFRDPEQLAMTYTALLSNNQQLNTVGLSLSTAELATTGDLIFTVSTTATAGTRTIVLKATDAGGLTNTATFTITVGTNSAPTATSGGTPTVNLITGVAFSEELAASTYFKDTDAGDTLALSLVGTPPAWLSVDTSTPGSLRLSGTPSAAGTYTLTVKATDGSGITVTRPINLVVAANAAPTAIPMTTQLAAIGETFLCSVPMSSLFTDANGDDLTLKATLSNGSPLPSWLNLEVLRDTNPPTVRLVGNVPDGLAVGTTYAVKITATDPSGAAATNTFNVSLVLSDLVLFAGTIPNVTATANGNTWTYQFPSSTFTQGNAAAPLTFTATGMPSWMSINASTGAISGVPSTIGNWTVTIKATAATGDTASATFVVTTPNAAPSVVTPIPNQSVTVSTALSYVFPAGTFADYNGQSLTYTASGMPAWMSFNASTRKFTGTAPATPAQYTITVTASDGTLSTPTTFLISVVQSGTNHAPTVNQTLLNGYSTTVVQGDYLDFYVSSAFADPDGDLLSYSQSGKPNWLNFDAATGHFWGTATVLAQTKTITVTASDGRGGTVSGTFTITNTGGGGGGQFAVTNDNSFAASQQSLVANTFTARQTVTAVTAATAFDQGNTSATSNYQISWYTYDGENRTEIFDGVLSGSQIVMTMANHSYQQLYDAVGNATVKVGYWFLTPNMQIQRSIYDPRGHVVLDYQQLDLGAAAPQGANLQSTYSYDDAGHLLQKVNYYANFDLTWTDQEGISYTRTAINWLASDDTYTYFLDGQLKTQESDDRADGWQADVEASWGAGTQSTQQNDLGVLDSSNVSIVMTSASYNAAGKLVGYNYTQDSGTPSQSGFSYIFTYEGHDNWLQLTSGGSTTSTTYHATTSVSTYDAFGREIAVTETTKQDSNPLHDYIGQRYMALDANGGVLERRDGYMKSGVFTQAEDSVQNPLQNPTPQWITNWSSYSSAAKVVVGNNFRTKRAVYVNGQLIGQTDQAGGFLDAISRLTAYSNSDTGAKDEIVQQGDTLQSIAQRVYGNSTLWYVIASANALDANSSLVAGTRVKVPQVETVKNDSTTFKPYNPDQITGNEVANFHIPPPRHGCSVIATIIRIVAVALSVIQPEFAPLIGLIGETVAQSVEIIQGYRQGFDIGAIAASLIPGPQTGFKALDAAILAIRRYEAAYAIDRVLGIETHFSWKNLAASAVTAAVTTEIFGPSGKDSAYGVGQTSAPTTPNLTGGFNWAAAAEAALKAIGREAIGYGVQKAIVGEAHWSWSNVAVSAVGEGLAAGLITPTQKMIDQQRAAAEAKAAQEAQRTQANGPPATPPTNPFGLPNSKDPLYGDGFDAVYAGSPHSLGRSGPLEEPVTDWSATTGDITLDLFRSDPANHLWDQMETNSSYLKDANKLLAAYPDLDKAPLENAQAAYNAAFDRNQHLTLGGVENATAAINDMIDAYGLPLHSQSSAPTVPDSAPPANLGAVVVQGQRPTIDVPPMLSSYYDSAVFGSNTHVDIAPNGWNPNADPIRALANGSGWGVLRAQYQSAALAQGIPRGGYSSAEVVPPIQKPSTGDSRVGMAVDWSSVEFWSDQLNHVKEVAAGGLDFTAKYKGQKILSSAWALQLDRMKRVALSDLDEASKVFKNPLGKTATALEESARKYGKVLKTLEVFGVLTTVAEEGAYVKKTFDNHPDQGWNSVGAAGTNVIGELGSMEVGAQTGAMIGAIPLLSVPTAGLSVPIVAGAGALIGYISYDWYVKPEVKRIWTGVAE